MSFRRTFVQALGHITFCGCKCRRGVKDTKMAKPFCKTFHTTSRDLSGERRRIFVSVNWTLPRVAFLYKTKSPAIAGLRLSSRYSPRTNIHWKPNKDLTKLCEASLLMSFRRTFVQALGHITFCGCKCSRGVKDTKRAKPFCKTFHPTSRDLSDERRRIFVSVNWTLPRVAFPYKTKSPAIAGLRLSSRYSPRTNISVASHSREMRLRLLGFSLLACRACKQALATSLRKNRPPEGFYSLTLKTE